MIFLQKNRLATVVALTLLLECKVPEKNTECIFLNPLAYPPSYYPRFVCFVYVERVKDKPIYLNEISTRKIRSNTIDQLIQCLDDSVILWDRNTNRKWNNLMWKNDCEFGHKVSNFEILEISYLINPSTRQVLFIYIVDPGRMRGKSPLVWFILRM